MDRKEFFRVRDEHFEEVEPGLRSARPVTRITPPERRCVHGYYTMSPLSADGSLLTWFEFDDLHPNRDVSREIPGRVMVGRPDGSDARPVAEVSGGSPCQGAMQQWVGDTHRVSHTNYYPFSESGWWIEDLDTGRTWHGTRHMREVRVADGAMEGFFHPRESVHMEAEEEGRSLAPEEVGTEIRDLDTDELKLRISVADVLAVHPEAEQVQRQHMTFKQTLFGPLGRRISFNFSNAWYARHREGEQYRHEKWIANGDGSGMRWLGPGATHPSWHPTGQYYTAIAPDEEGVERFMLYPVDGGPARPIGPDWPATGHPSFQPGDGRYLAVDCRDPETGHIFLRLFDTRELAWEDILVAEFTDYTNASGVHMHPAWTPDGRSVYIDAAHTEAAGMYRVDLF